MGEYREIGTERETAKRGEGESRGDKEGETETRGMEKQIGEFI